MNYINKIVDEYDPETFEAAPVLKEMEEKYPTISTRSVRLSQLRSRLMLKTPVDGYDNMKEYYVEMRRLKKDAVLHPELAKLKLTNGEYGEIQKKKKQSVKNKNLKSLIIHNSEEFKAEILEGLESNTYNKLFPALLLATGRRSIEVLKTAKFSRKKEKNVFKGQAKDKSKKQYSIPLLAPIKQIQKAVRKLRKLLPEIKEDNLDNEQVQELVHGRNKLLFKKLSEKYNVKLTPHAMRGLYVAYAYKIYEGDASFLGFTSQVLGHEDLDASVHYVNIRLK